MNGSVSLLKAIWNLLCKWIKLNKASVLSRFKIYWCANIYSTAMYLVSWADKVSGAWLILQLSRRKTSWFLRRTRTKTVPASIFTFIQALSSCYAVTPPDGILSPVKTETDFFPSHPPITSGALGLSLFFCWLFLRQGFKLLQASLHSVLPDR